MLDTLVDIRVRAPRSTSRCSVELADAIAADISSGVHDYVAAGVHGVTPLYFRAWLDRGRAECEESVSSVDSVDSEEAVEEVSVYAYFFLTILKSSSNARAAAEKRVHRDKPEIWLAKGPGRADWGDGHGSNISVNVSTSQQVNMTLTPPVMTAEQLLEVAGILREVGYLPDPNVVESIPSAEGETLE